MDYNPPPKIVGSMIDAGAAKAALSLRDMIVRGFLSGALLGFATSLAVTAAVQTSLPVVGALVFPVGFVMIVLLGLELVTGNFALLPVAWIEQRCTSGQVLVNFTCVFLGNLLGSLFYAALFAGSVSFMGHVAPDAVAQKIIAIAEAKTNGYAGQGLAGLLTLLTRALLCNWMVCLGAVLGMASSSTSGKIAAAWLPIFTFFAHGYEHSVVNMFVIPAGIFLGAKVTVADWWTSNQIPSTVGNLVGGGLFTGLLIYWTHRPKPEPEPEKRDLD
jgi:formate transporter